MAHNVQRRFWFLTFNVQRFNLQQDRGHGLTVPLVVFQSEIRLLDNRKIIKYGLSNSMRYAKVTYSVILAGGVLWCAAIVLAPVFAASPGILREAGEVLYAFFNSICHQIEGRSFLMSGMPFAVCSRCAAIYFGFLVGVLIYPLVRGIERPGMPSRLFLVIACIPMIVDAFPWRFGIYVTTNATRAITGGIVGFTLAFFIVPAAIQAVSELAGIRSLTVCQEKGISNATEAR